jgi:transposase
MNGIMYVLNTGCQWLASPKHLPPKSTVHDYLDLWSRDGTLDRIHQALYVACRKQDGNQLPKPKLIKGVKFTDGIETIPPHAQAAG